MWKSSRYTAGVNDEIFNEKENNNITKIYDIDNLNKNMALNIRSTLINNKKNKNNNPNNTKRTTFSPTTLLIIEKIISTIILIQKLIMFKGN